jgi:leucyl-tRNA synthetase
VKRFLEKTWHFYVNVVDAKDKKINVDKQKEKEFLNELEVLRHKTIKKVSNDIEEAKFNTAISTMMEYLNKLADINNLGYKIPKDHYKTFVILLSPFAPHLCEEI